MRENAMGLKKKTFEPINPCSTCDIRNCYGRNIKVAYM